MNNYSKKTWFSVLLLLISAFTYAGNITIKAPSAVTINQTFSILYSIDNINTKFIEPVFSSDFLVVAGPMESTHHYSGIDSSSQSRTYTYYIQAVKEGVYDIPPAQFKLKDGTIVTSEKKAIEVTATVTEQDNGGNEDEETINIKPEDLFLKLELDSAEFKAGQILLTVRLYAYELPVTSVADMKFAQFTDFEVQEQLAVSQAESVLHPKVYNNKPYQSVVLGRFILSPLKTGEIKIPPAEAEIILEYQKSNPDLFDVFFNGTIYPVSKQLKSEPLTITIKGDTLKKKTKKTDKAKSVSGIFAMHLPESCQEIEIALLRDSAEPMTNFWFV